MEVPRVVANPNRPLPLRSAKSTIVSWVDQEINGGEIPLENVKIRDVIDAVKTRFFVNQAFADRFLDEMLEDTLQMVVREVVGQTRGLYRREISNDTIVSPTTFVQKNAAELGARLNKMSEKWSSWLEHVGDRHIRLMSMRKQDLMNAAQERRRRADREIEIATLWEALANAMPDNNVTVGETFTLSQIETVSSRIKAKADGTLAQDAEIAPEGVL
jgi:hypothetical protein